MFMLSLLLSESMNLQVHKQYYNNAVYKTCYPDEAQYKFQN